VMYVLFGFVTAIPLIFLAVFLQKKSKKDKS
jgi:hypothetical protein